MIKQMLMPTKMAWNFVSFGLCVFLCGSGWSISRAKVYQIELAQYKLEVGSALSEVKKVSDTLERSAQTSPIAPKQKQKIQQLTKKSSAVIEQVEAEIDEETDKLIYLHEE